MAIPLDEDWHPRFQAKLRQLLSLVPRRASTEWAKARIEGQHSADPEAAAEDFVHHFRELIQRDGKKPVDDYDPGDIPSSLSCLVVPIFMLKSDGRMDQLGSATVIGKAGRVAIAITAKHNFDALVSERSKHPTEVPPPRFREILIPIGEPLLFMSKVFEIVLCGATDIAYLYLLAPEDKQFPFAAPIDPAPVEQFVEISAIGLPAMELKHVFDEEHPETHYSGVTSETHGFVLGRFDSLESQMITWPVCQVTARIASGMSGGPLVQRLEGDSFVVRAVLCRDVDIEGGVDGAGSGLAAFASEIWPTLSSMGFKVAATEKPDGTFFDMFATGGAIPNPGNCRENFYAVVGSDGQKTLGWRHGDVKLSLPASTPLDEHISLD